MLWYAYEENSMNWHILSAENANKIIQINKKGKKVHSLEEFAMEDETDKILNHVI